MKLSDCMLDVDWAVAAPLVIDRPEPDWVRVRDSGRLPENIFSFYCRSNYFSFEKAPRFLSDKDRLLFSFLAALTLGIRDALDEAHDLIIEVRKCHDAAYSPTKRAEGKEYDRTSLARQMRSFKYLIVSLSSALDQFAETVALLFTGEVDNLKFGRASFVTLKNFAQKPFHEGSGVVAPKAHFLGNLHAALSKEMTGVGPEEDWLGLFYLYRNKLSHLGGFMFPSIGLHDKTGKFFSFLPNKWPQLHQTKIKVRNASEVRDPDEFRKYAEGSFAHPDITEYSEGLVKRIKKLLNSGFGVLCEAYAAFIDFAPNLEALESLEKESETTQFKNFVNI